MPQSLSQVFVHLVFSTKHRQPFISDKIAPELYAYMAKILYDECASPPKIIGGVADHVHILLNLSRTWAIANVVEAVKTSSSKWIKKRDEKLYEFYWQTGYGAFSVSRSQLDVVTNYILKQKAHHQSSGFQEEYIGLLKKHQIEYDEKYVWD